MKAKAKKRAYKKDTAKRISYTISSDVKNLQKMLNKLQQDVDKLRIVAKGK
jgi:hypothetical protein